MELTDRKIRILRALIEDHMADGQPVGSRALSKRPGLSLSAATLRNEMADLEEMGYLSKPHTSAGRIPTHSAYRLYVTSMLDVRTLNDGERQVLDDSFSGPLNDAGQVLAAAAEAISKATGCIAAIASPTLGGAGLQRIQIFRVARDRAMAVLVTQAGGVHQTSFPVAPGVTDRELGEISALATSAAAGVRLSVACERMRSMLSGPGATDKYVMRELFSAINRNKDAMDTILEGRQNIWLHPEYRDWQKAQRFLALLETREWVEKLLNGAQEAEFSLKLGTEAAGADLPDLGVVTGVYSAGGGSRALFGVIGPARMNYPKVLPVLRSAGVYITRALQQLQNAGGAQ